jgi:hypothetical protein
MINQVPKEKINLRRRKAIVEANQRIKKAGG